MAPPLSDVGVRACPVVAAAVALHEAIGLEHAEPTSLALRDSTNAADDVADDDAAPAPGSLRRLRATSTSDQETGGAAGGAAGGGEARDSTSALQARHRAISEAFAAGATQTHAGADGADGEAAGLEASELSGDDDRLPLLVTFEDMAVRRYGSI